jgi:phosphoribosylamine---glycine ligase
MGLDFVRRCATAGHDVRWYIHSTKPVRDGEGMTGFRIVSDWRSSMSWARDGLIVTTGNWRFTQELDRYREFGFKIFGPTVASAKLEIDRSAGQQAMEAAGIELIPFETFDNLKAAREFAAKHDETYVFKPTGDEADKSLTYVSHDPEDLCGWLDRQIRAGKALKGKCMLQQKVDLLCELGVSGWFGPEGFLSDKWQVCVEHKNLMDGEIGPATGEMGTVCQYTAADKLAAEMLIPMEPILRNLGHHGDFAIGCGIDKRGKAWPFEFTCRLGWPAYFIQMASHRGDSVQWMLDLLDGKDSLKVSYDVAIGVVMGQPRFPYNISPPELVEGNPIRGIEEIGNAAHLVSIMQHGGKYETSGEYVMCVTSLGKTIERSREKAYAAVDKIKFANRIFRQDIGQKVIDCLPKLQEFGYLSDMRA